MWCTKFKMIRNKNLLNNKVHTVRYILLYVLSTI
jgi:hypothetical protein